jgi:hypothetical protein
MTLREKVVKVLQQGHFTDGSVADAIIREVFSEQASLQARLEAAEKDAARYRWLRDKSTGAPAIWELVSDEHNPPYWTLKCEEELDAATDAALAKKESKT